MALSTTLWSLQKATECRSHSSLHKGFIASVNKPGRSLGSWDTPAVISTMSMVKSHLSELSSLL
eukprot:1104125-Amphidinium_carterae.1